MTKCMLMQFFYCCLCSMTTGMVALVAGKSKVCRVKYNCTFAGQSESTAAPKSSPRHFMSVSSCQQLVASLDLLVVLAWPTRGQACIALSLRSPPQYAVRVLCCVISHPCSSQGQLEAAAAAAVGQAAAVGAASRQGCSSSSWHRPHHNNSRWVGGSGTG